MVEVLLVDGKLNPDTKQFKITEFGCGFNSNFSGFNALDPFELQTCVLQELQKKYDHVFLMNITPDYITHQVAKRVSNCSVIDCYQNEGMGDYSTSSPEEIDEENWADKIREHGQNACVIVQCHDSITARIYAMELKNHFLKNNIPAPIINSDGGCFPLPEDKAFFRYLDQTPDVSLIDLENIPPSIYPSGTKWVIKPTDQSSGDGVNITENPKEVLEAIAAAQSNTKQQNQIDEKVKQYLAGDDKGHIYWKKEQSNRHALVEPWYAGTQIKDRETTARMVFIVDDNNDVIPIRGYWKLAPHGKLVSDVSDNINDACPISSQDQGVIFNSLVPQIKSIVGKAKEKSFTQHIDDMKNVPTYDKYSEILSSRMNNYTMSPRVKGRDTNNYRENWPKISDLEREISESLIKMPVSPSPSNNISNPIMAVPIQNSAPLPYTPPIITHNDTNFNTHNNTHNNNNQSSLREETAPLLNKEKKQGCCLIL